MAKGCACKFLYGDETSEAETAAIDSALEYQREHKTEIILYKKNGNPFWCLMDIVPIKNERRQVVLFLVSHKDVSKEKDLSGAEHVTSDNHENHCSMDKGDSDSSQSEDEENIEMPENYNYSRRRSRAVLYHISGQLNKQNKAKAKLQQLNRQLGSQMPEYKVQEIKKSKLVIVHYGLFKIGWDWLILLCTFYVAIMVPFNAAFSKEGRQKDLVYIDVIVEVLFAIDIVLNFRTSFVKKNGQVCYDSRLIALYYIRGWFLLDLLAAIPFDLLYAFDVDTGTFIHLLKVARLLRLARLLQKIERYSQYSIFVVAILMCIFTLLAHWLACVWYAIGRQELYENPVNWTVGWLFELAERLENPIQNRSNGPDTMTCYVTALYFTCSSLTSVGFGNVSANTNAEKIFSICAMLVGAMMHAVVFGNVTAFIQRMYARRASFHSKTKDLKEFFRFHHFPKPLKTRMQEFFQTTWSVNNGIDVREIMKDFPEDLRGEISLHLNREILSLPIFITATQGCLRSVALQTNRVFFGPGEVLIHKGDAIRNIYYVCNGSLEVLKDDQVVAILGKGDLFGSDIKFDDPICISGCDVRSLAYCELLCINTCGMVECLHPYPEFTVKFLEEFPCDLTYNLREGHEDINEDDTLLPAVSTLPVITEDDEDEFSASSKSNDMDDRSLDDITASANQSPLLQEFPLLSERNELQIVIGTGLKHSFPSNGTKFLAKNITSNGDLINGLRDSGQLTEGNITTYSTSPLARNSVSGLQPVTVATTSTLVESSCSNFTRPALTRGASVSPAYLRTLSASFSPACCRSQKTATNARRPYVSWQKSEELSQILTLQQEVESTRNAVDRFQLRMDSLCSDVTVMRQTLSLILQTMNTKTIQKDSVAPADVSGQTSSAMNDIIPNSKFSCMPSYYATANPANSIRTSLCETHKQVSFSVSQKSSTIDRHEDANFTNTLALCGCTKHNNIRSSSLFENSSSESDFFDKFFTTVCSHRSCGSLASIKQSSHDASCRKEPNLSSTSACLKVAANNCSTQSCRLDNVQSCSSKSDSEQLASDSFLTTFITTNEENPNSYSLCGNNRIPTTYAIIKTYDDILEANVRVVSSMISMPQFITCTAEQLRPSLKNEQVLLTSGLSQHNQEKLNSQGCLCKQKSYNLSETNTDLDNEYKSDRIAEYSLHVKCSDLSTSATNPAFYDINSHGLQTSDHIDATDNERNISMVDADTKWSKRVMPVRSNKLSLSPPDPIFAPFCLSESFADLCESQESTEV